MKACKVCDAPAEFFVGNLFYCSLHASKLKGEMVPVRIACDDEEWKKGVIRKKVQRRIEKISQLGVKLIKRTQKVMEKVAELHFAAFMKLREKNDELLRLLSCDDLNYAYRKLNTKFYCGLLKDHPCTEELTAFYTQEFISEAEISKNSKTPKTLEGSIKFLEMNHSLFVEDYKSPISLLAVFKDNSQIVVVDSENSLRFFSLTEKIQKFCIKNSEDLKYLQVVDDESKLLAVSTTGKLLIWALKDYNLANDSQITNSEIISCLLMDDLLFLSTKDLKILKVSLKDYQSDLVLETKAETSTLSLSSVPNHFICGCSNGEILLFNIKTSELKTLVTGPAPVTALDSAKHLDLFFAAFANKVVQVWSIEPLNCVASIVGHIDCITSILISPDDAHIITSSHDKRIRIFNIQSKKIEITLNPLSSQVSSMVISADKKYLYILANNLKIYGFDQKRYLEKPLTCSHSNVVNCLVFNKDMTRVITGSKDKSIKIWKITKKKLVATLLGHTDEVTDLMLNENEKVLISVSNDRTIRTWNLQENKQFAVFNSSYKTVKVWMDKLAETLIVLSEDKNIRVFSISTAKLMHQFQANAQISFKFLVLNEGKFVIVVSEEKSLKVLNVPDKKIEKVLNSHISPVVAIHTLASSPVLVSCSVEGTLNVWSKVDFTLISSISVGQDANSILLSDDNLFVAAGYSDCSVKIFYLNRGSLFETIHKPCKSYWAKRYPNLV